MTQPGLGDDVPCSCGQWGRVRTTELGPNGLAAVIVMHVDADDHRVEGDDLTALQTQLKGQ